ncbi:MULTISPECIES: homoserine kinase [Flavobacterium]|uniref:homoserine kinase n=1 Tax=Flavobacterium TaxID=237 RepID=UPI001FCB4C72|nr:MULTISPECIES: homoserine kinase [Flavobacterium]UOK42023.1 homoserine kinase [Flavobacterium enshiense]
MESIRIFSPATVANLSCGFDVLGLCLDTIGDEMIVRKSNKKGIRITKITGADLPLEIDKNVAGVAALALVNTYETDFGFEIEIHKKIKAGSGIGSSAASAAGAVFGINKLLGEPFSGNELIYYAMKGEALASGNEHADNVAPALLGGFTLVRGYDPLDVIKIKSPEELYVTILHPHIELKTSEMRAILKPEIKLKNAIRQWGNVGGLVAGLYTNDYDLIGRSLTDYIVEPLRSKFIPGFDQAKKTAIENGALGAGISGSGPSIFTLNKGLKNATSVNDQLKEIYQKNDIPFETFISKVNPDGIRIIE